MKKIFKIVLEILIELSMGAFALTMLTEAYFTRPYKIATLVLAIVFGFLFAKRRIEGLLDFLNSHKVEAVLLAVFSILVECEIYSATKRFSIIVYVAATLALFALITFAYSQLRWYLCDVVSQLDKKDGLIFGIGAAFTTLLMIYNYATNPMYYLVMDGLFSLDTYGVAAMFGFNPICYDVRHPLIGLVLFPIYVLAKTLVTSFGSFVYAETLVFIILQLANVIMLIWIAMTLKVLTNNRFVGMAFMLSFGNILYAMVYEKYVTCIFVLLMYVYYRLRKNEDATDKLVMTTGVIATSGVMVLLEICSAKTWKERGKRLLEFVICGVGMLTCFGKIHMLIPSNILADLSQQMSWFAEGQWSMVARMRSAMTMLENAVVAIPVLKYPYIVNWDLSFENNVSVAAIVILILLVIGFLFKAKDSFARVCFAWIVFAFVLIGPINWSPSESPIFNLYFAWAVIPLLCMAIDGLCDLFKLKKNVVHGILLSGLAIVNFSMLAILNTYLLELVPMYSDWLSQIRM